MKVTLSQALYCILSVLSDFCLIIVLLHAIFIYVLFNFLSPALHALFIEYLIVNLIM